MKSWNVEVRKIRAMAHANGRLRVQVDGSVQPAAAGRDGELPATVIEFDEETARVLLLLLKNQLAELDARKPKSRRG